MANEVYLGLGSNKGDREKYIIDAVNKIIQQNKIVLQLTSSLYETKPFGFENQNNFLNLVISVRTNAEALKLLDILKDIEKKVGRTNSFKWGPREIDIDILLFGDIVIDEEKLTIPHKHLMNRDFFYIPILEINPNILLPESGKKLKDLIPSKNENFIVNKFEFKI